MQHSRYRSSGFTLIEILVVITIIAVLATMVAFVSFGGGVPLDGGQRVAGSMAQAARAQALVKSTNARLLVMKSHDDSSQNAANRLRYMGLIYEEPPNSGQWVTANPGTTLPNEAYFHEDLSTRGGGSNSQPESMRFDFGKAQPQQEGSGDADWYYYEWNASGISQNSGARFVLVLGRPINADGDLQLDENQISGFVINKSGNVSVAHDPEDLRTR